MNKKSFTLIELLVVIAIIGILSSLVIARFSDWGDNARIANTLQWSAGVHRTLGASLVGYWPLNGDANDISGYNNHGEMHNFTGEPDDYWVDSVAGTGNQALKFDGVDDYIGIGDNDVLDVKENKTTIGMWLKMNTIATEGCQILGKFNYRFSGYYVFMYEDENKVSLGFHGENAVVITKTNDITYGNWHYIAITLNGSIAKVYLDGEFQNMSTNVTNIGNSNNILIIGGYGTSSVNGDKEIADVKIYSTALTAEEVGRIYAESKDKYLVEGL